MLLSLEVEPSYLARVSDASFGNADLESAKFVRRAKGEHALFHVRSKHGVQLVYRGTGDNARLYIPSSCR